MDSWFEIYTCVFCHSYDQEVLSNDTLGALIQCGECGFARVIASEAIDSKMTQLYSL